MLVIERKFGESIKFISESEEVNLTILRDKNNRIKIGIESSDNVDVQLKETHQRLQADLKQQVESYYHSIRQPEPLITPIPIKTESITKPKILLTEDTEIIRRINTAFLESLGCEVVSAQDGRETFDFLQNKYDLILLDIGLPDISGIKICKWIRKYSINKNTPIIFLTAFGDQVKAKCKKAGCDDFATKPLSMEKLQKLIKKWLPKKTINIEDTHERS